MELGQGTRSEGAAFLEGMLQVPLLMLCLSSLFFFFGIPFFFLVVFALSGCLLIVIF